MSEIIVCRECGARIESFRPASDESGVWVCENGHECGVWLNQGTLDLRLVEADAERKSDFTIFTEPY